MILQSIGLYDLEIRILMQFHLIFRIVIRSSKLMFAVGIQNNTLKGQI